MKKAHSNRSGTYRFAVNRSGVLTAAVAAAIGAIATLTPATFAQQRIGGDGRLMDANNRVGSGGFNDSSSSALPPGVFGNAIVSGDVTGGRGFAGNIPYFAPGAFHGNLPGGFVDNFVSGSTNVQTNGTVVNNAQDVHLFLGDDRGVNPPSNFISTGAQPGYIPNAAISDTQFTSDTRLGVPVSSPISSYVPSAIFQTGGTQAGSGSSTYVTNSALFGVKTLQTAQQVDGQAQYSGSALGNGSLNSALGTGDRVDLSSDLRPAALSQSNNPDQTSLNDQGLSGLPSGVASFAMPQASANGSNGSLNPSGIPGAPASPSTPGAAPRSQIANAAGSNSNGANANGSANGQGQNGQSQNGTENGSITGSNGPIDSAINTQISAAIPSGYPVNATVGGSAFSGSLNTGESTSTNIYSKDQPWNQPKTAYQAMLARFKTINPNAPLTAEQKILLNQAKLFDIKSAEEKGTENGVAGRPAALGSGPNGERSVAGSAAAPPGMGSAPGSTGAGQLPQPSAVGPLVPQQVAPGGDKNKPVFINSFSGDATSPGVKEHLAKAEDLMKQGKFTSALEEYDLVEQQAPSNPYIELGRANAELGASYYGLAEAHLRQAFMSNQALLSAQLDLHTFLGEDKLQYLVKDLKQIAEANPTESRPVFLLAYICYNTNNPRGAAAYLDLAEKREGKPDPFFKLVRQNWDLPAISDEKGDTGLNK